MNKKTIYFLLINLILFGIIYYINFITENKFWLNYADHTIFIRNQVTNILTVIIFSYSLSKIYDHLNVFTIDKFKLYQSLVPISLITYLIISIISVSLSLSLGMVGALSLIRFRTAVKDLSDITFLFCAFAIGIAVGARMYLALIAIYPMILLSFYFYSKSKKTLITYFVDIQSEKNQQDLVFLVEKKLTEMFFSEQVAFNLNENNMQSIHKITTDNIQTAKQIKDTIAEFSKQKISISITKANE